MAHNTTAHESKWQQVSACISAMDDVIYLAQQTIKSVHAGAIGESDAYAAIMQCEDEHVEAELKFYALANDGLESDGHGYPGHLIATYHDVSDTAGARIKKLRHVVLHAPFNH